MELASVGFAEISLLVRLAEHYLAQRRASSSIGAS
jgi:hypothetical protein